MKILSLLFVGLVVASGALSVGQNLTGPRVAVLVGVKSYPINSGWGSLSYSEDDVTELASVLKELGYEVKTIVGGEATRESIRNAIEDISDTYHFRGRGKIIFYFTGHGCVRESHSASAFATAVAIN